MRRLPVTANKSNLLRLKEELVFAADGLELLDQKKAALMPHISSLATKAEQVRAGLYELLNMAYGHLREAILSQGRMACERVCQADSLGAGVEVRQKSFMGVALPTVRLTLPDLRPPYGFQGTTAPMDALLITIRQSLDVMAELAEIEVGLFRLLTEIDKTMKRINALENIYIPLYTATIKHIEESLEEKEREFLFQLKRQKGRGREVGHDGV